MNLAICWIIAKKDLKEFLRKRIVLYTVVMLPLLLSILFPAIIWEVQRRNAHLGPVGLAGLMSTFAWFFVIIPAIIPGPIASYSIVGEKVEKSLEPLLATPTTDGEILLGKSIAAFLPAIVSSYVGATIFMTLMDVVTYGNLGYLYYPNWGMAVVLLILAPVTAILAIEANVVASSRVNDVRSASQLGGLMFLPFVVIYVASEIGLIDLNTNNLLIIAGILAVAALILFRFATAIFRREEILTKWK